MGFSSHKSSQVIRKNPQVKSSQVIRLWNNCQVKSSQVIRLWNNCQVKSSQVMVFSKNFQVIQIVQVKSSQSQVRLKIQVRSCDILVAHELK